MFDENGDRVRGKEHKEAAEVSLAKEKLTWSDGDDAFAFNGGQCLVARV